MQTLMKQYENKDFSPLIVMIDPTVDRDNMPNVTTIEEAKIYIENLYPDTIAIIDIMVNKVFLMSKDSNEIVKTLV